MTRKRKIKTKKASNKHKAILAKERKKDNTKEEKWEKEKSEESQHMKERKKERKWHVI